MAKRVRYSCIYSITNTTNQKRYIGSTCDFLRRLLVHKKHLKDNKHRNDYLQKAYNKYGIKSFCFEVIETCPVENLLIREAYWIKEYKTSKYEHGYNIMDVDPKSNTITVISPEKRKQANQKQIQTCIEKYGWISKEEVVRIREMYMDGYERGELAKIFNRNPITVSDVFRNRTYYDPNYNPDAFRWKFLNPDLREEIDKLHKKGFPYHKISKILHLSKDRIKNYLDPNSKNAVTTGRGKLVLNLETGIYYNSIREAEYSSGLGSKLDLGHNVKRKPQLVSQFQIL